jgi:hypothetical protein
MLKRKKTDTVQFKLRIREALRSRLESEAKKHEISINAEMVRRLEASFFGPDLLHGFRVEMDAAIQPLRQEVGRLGAVVDKKLVGG